MSDSGVPPLPEPVTFNDVSHYHGPRAYPQEAPSLADTAQLNHGCYFAQWLPRNVNPYFPHRYNGVMRIQRHPRGVTASGDFYYHPAFVWSGGHLRVNPDPNPRAGIPIFNRVSYSFYLHVGHVLFKSGNRVDIVFERHSLEDVKTSTWKDDGVFTAYMKFTPAPTSYPSGATYLKGDIRTGWDPGSPGSGTLVGSLTLEWVSKYLRKAIVEVDRVPLSEYPADNRLGLNWREVYKEVDWDVIVYQSNSNVPESSGESWNMAEMHEAMLKWRFSGDLDRQWRYYLLCVRKNDRNGYGVMFDYRAADSNKVPREGACISSHPVFRNNPSKWGGMAGKRTGVTPGYFRTAVHEIGHAMGLAHYNLDNGFMRPTMDIARVPGKFLDNVQWSFSAADEHRLRHMPDPWVRPGMIPFSSYSSAPVSIQDRIDLSESLRLEMKPLLSTVPIGAPVRVKLTLRNKTDALLKVPASLSLNSGRVCGLVVGPGGSSRGFRALMSCVEEQVHQKLEAGAETSHDLTLLRGGDGALFESPGLHSIKVEITWAVDDAPFCVRGSSPIMVQPAMTDSHAAAALKTLSTPDLLITLAVGGDHLEAGVEALQAALADKTLRPHYAVIEAKRIGRRFGTRNADPSAAVKLLSSDTVMSSSEVKSVLSLVGGVAKKASTAMEALKKSAAGDKTAEDMVNRL